MKSRSTPLPTPSAPHPRYWVTELEGHGPHWFKHPYYAVGAAVVSTMLAHQAMLPPAGEPSPELEQARAIAVLPMAGLLIGTCWSHLDRELVTRFPLTDTSQASLTAYGHAVAEELQDAGYDIVSMLTLFASIAPEMGRRQSVLAQAMERSAFFEAPKAV